MPDKKTVPKGAIKHSLRYCFGQIIRYKKSYLAVSVLNVIVEAAVPFAEIIFLPLLIDALTSDEKDLRLIIFYGAAFVVMQLFLQGVNSCLTTHLSKGEDLFMNASREEIAERCMEMDFTLTENKEALDQIKKADEGVGWSGGAHNIARPFFGIVTNIIKLCGVAAVLIINAPLLLAIIIVILAVQAVINAKKNGIEIKNFAEIANIDRVFWYICWEMEDFHYGKDIRLYSAAGMMIEKSMQQIKRINNYFENINSKKYPLNILDIIVGSLQDLGTYFYLGALAITGKITVGTFSQLVSAGGTLYQATQGIVLSLQDIAKRSSYMYEAVKFMEYPPVMEKGSRQIENLNSGHEIEFRNVSFSYPGSDVKVLRNVSIKLKSGEMLSVVGLNGAGKTTFIKLLCRLYDVDSGEILLDGINIRDYDYEEYMKLFSVVFQDFKLIAFSAADNILLGKEDSSETVDVLFEKVGIAEKIKSLPKGRDTMMFKQFEKDGVELSGGEQQKLAIARALYKNSPVVILDEPTAALDPVAEYEIYRQFNDLVYGKTAVYISHRLSSCKFCEHIAVFSEGTIMEYGTHDELVRKKDGIYAEMFKAQAQYYI